jgi:hypothetical protein
MRRASYALAGYLAIALVVTWPLGRGLGRDVAWDLGDSVLNMWILAWDSKQLLAILGGELSRVRSFFDGNIFHPAQLTLAYSEHLFAQAVQALPVYAISANPILAYNLLFLSTFVLCGLGMYLLVRELTGSALAGFVAGLLFAFAPYRLSQSSHLQVLSSQWMPFVFYGVRRYFTQPAGPAPPRLRPLLWASAALVTQCLSCGYYLLYFTPFAVGYVFWEITQRRLRRDLRVWRHVGIAGLLTIAIVGPFLVPYAEVRQRFDMARTLSEVTRLSADVYSYATAFPEQPLWGRVMQAFPKREGELFPGLVPPALALIGLLFFRLKPEGSVVDRGFGLQRLFGGFRLSAAAKPSARPRRSAQHEGGQPQGMRRLATVLLAAAAVAHVAAALYTIVARRVLIDFGLFELRMTNVTQLLVRAAVAFGLVLVLSPQARVRTASFLRDRGFFLVALVVALWLSLGPAPQALGRPLDLFAPYGLLYEYVPGFEGVRAPARLAMVVTFMLAVLGGYGAAVLARWKWGSRVLCAVAAMFLLEGTAVPFLVNGVTPPSGFHAPEARLYRPARAPAIYHEAERQLGDGVLAELPLGYPDFDLRAMYYSTVHWRPILNGYSGFYPPHYGQLAFALGELPRHPELSLEALRAAGATHVLVHEGAYLGNEGAQTSDALRQQGAAELYRDGTDALLRLPH